MIKAQDIDIETVKNSYGEELREAMEYLRSSDGKYKNFPAAKMVWQLVVDSFGDSYLSCHGFSSQTGMCGKRYMVKIKDDQDTLLSC